MSGAALLPGDWDYSAKLRRDFVETQWALIREESSRGTGTNLVVFSLMMGCFDKNQLEFKKMLKVNYEDLYPDSSTSSPQHASGLIEQIKGLVRGNKNLNCSG